MLESDPYVKQQRHALIVCSKCALACFVILTGIIAVQAVTGTILSLKSLEVPPSDAAHTTVMIDSYAMLRSLHATLGQLALIPGFAVLAFSILFMLNVGGVGARLTRFTWGQVFKAGVLVIILVGICLGGRLFAIELKGSRFWLLLEPEAVTENPGVTMDGFSSTAFYTFVGLHGIVLPFLAVIVIIFMWAPFSEFSRERREREFRGPAFQKWSLIIEAGGNTTNEGPPEEPDDDTPAGWKAMRRMAEGASRADEEDDTSDE